MYRMGERMVGVAKVRGRSVSAVGVVFILVSVLFTSLIIVSDETAAGSLSVNSLAAYDATIRYMGDSYPPVTDQYFYAWDYTMIVGQYYSAVTTYDYAMFEAFMTFNTSAVPVDATIVSAVLSVRGSTDYSVTDFAIQVYTSDYGTLDVGDLGNQDAYQGVLLDTSSYVLGSWHSVNIAASAINKSGYTQLSLVSDRQHASITPSNAEYMWVYTGDSSSPPTLEVNYVIGGVAVCIELDSGSWLNGTAYPDVQDWNLTYDLHCYELDTVPGSKNMTIAKQDANWTMAGLSPGCNYTETDTELLLWDVYDSICYRIWFYVPKSNPYTSVHLSLYNSFTGEGFFWEQMKVMICDGLTWDNTTAEYVTRADFEVEPNRNYTVRALDFFDNALVDYSFVANAQDIYLSIPVPYYSWQVFNMNEQPVLMKIYWNNSGSPWEFFVGPQWIIERNLKGGNYTFMVTFYEADGTAGSTVSYQRTVPNAGLNASFIYISGTNLSEIISDIEGVMATQLIITSLISPSTILIYENLPLAPVQIRSLALEDSIVIDPYEILEATTYQNATCTRYIDSTLLQTHPDVVGATYYVLSDTLSFSGTYATEMYINDSLGANLYHATVLPATVNLQGQELTIWANTNISVSRASTWREVTEYAINYYPTQFKWQTNLVLNNTYALDYYSPYWYIAFPAGAVINQATVTLYDLDNGVYLSQRTNFDVTAGGVHVTLTQLNSSSARNFRLTFWDDNSTTAIGAPNLIAEAYTSSTLNGVPMKYTAVQFFNPYSVEYRGEIYITLNFTYGDYLLKSSIRILDQTTGSLVSTNQWIYTGRTIIILTDGVGTVPVGGARNYGIYFTLDYTSAAEDKSDFFFGPIVIGGKQFYINNYAVSWFVVMVIGLWALTAWLWWTSKPQAFNMVILSAAFTVIGSYLGSFM